MDNAGTTVAQLLESQWEIDTKGRSKVEPKEDIIERLGRSPDNADALLLAFFALNGATTNYLDYLLSRHP